VIGLVSTARDGAPLQCWRESPVLKKKKRSTEIEIIKKSYQKLDADREDMKVEIDGDNVVIAKGETTMKTARKGRGK
jgi:hypothetical protein